MMKEKILVIGASGQIGVELTLALRNIYGNANVIASDLREENDLLKGTGPYVSLDVMNKEMLHVQVIRQNITQIYLLAAILSATGEKNPNLAWHLNMQSLLNVLDIAREEESCTRLLGQQHCRVRPYFSQTESENGRHHLSTVFRWYPHRSARDLRYDAGEFSGKLRYHRQRASECPNKICIWLIRVSN